MTEPTRDAASAWPGREARHPRVGGRRSGPVYVGRVEPVDVGRAAPAGVGRQVARLGPWLAGLLALPGTASAHGAVDAGPEPVAFALVVGLPLVAGLLGGLATVRVGGAAVDLAGARPTSRSFGLLLVVLGVTFAVDAAPWTHPVAVAGLTAGVVGAAWVAGRGGLSGCRDHAHLTVGAVGVHRAMEGLVLGALYATGVAVGLLAAVAVAGHAALETGAVGGSLGTRERRAVGAVVVVQLGFGLGAVVGVVAGASVPEPVRVGALALAGGVLLVAGTTAARGPVLGGHPTTRTPAAGDGSRADAE